MSIPDGHQKGDLHPRLDSNSEIQIGDRGPKTGSSKVRNDRNFHLWPRLLAGYFPILRVI